MDKIEKQKIVPVGGHKLAPLIGCVLIGGQSSRMGRPKHLLRTTSGVTWLEDKVSLLENYVEKVVISGAGQVDANLAQCERVSDATGVVGPMAGILGVMQRYPQNSLLVCACDMPLVVAPAVEWLLEQRASGRWAVIPKQYGLKKGKETLLPEPLFACYEKESKSYIEELAEKEIFKMSRLATLSGVYCPEIPTKHKESWRNINTPDDAYFADEE